jgi:hypothetical protein
MSADKRKSYHGGTETQRKPEMDVEFIKDLDPILSATIRVDPRQVLSVFLPFSALLPCNFFAFLRVSVPPW